MPVGKYIRHAVKRAVARPPYIDPNDPSTTVIPLTRGYVAYVDTADAHLVVPYNWFAKVCRTGHIYASRRVRLGEGVSSQKILMHTALTGFSLVDHKDGNGLNNRRRNLRECSKAENNRNCARRRDNSTGLKGAIATKQPNRWAARIRSGGKQVHLGRFSSPEEAHEAYKKAADRLHGEYARYE